MLRRGMVGAIRLRRTSPLRRLHMDPIRLSREEKKLIRQIQGDLPVVKTPFALPAQKAGMEEKEFLRRVRSLVRKGLIRRFGAILRHQKAGYRGNAMVVWIVPEDRVAEAGRMVASFPAVSHCYQRPAQPRWPYNLYAMVHGKNERDCRAAARKISREAGLKDYRLLFSRREHKKSSMRYVK